MVSSSQYPVRGGGPLTNEFLLLLYAAVLSYPYPCSRSVSRPLRSFGTNTNDTGGGGNDESESETSSADEKVSRTSSFNNNPFDEDCREELSSVDEDVSELLSLISVEFNCCSSNIFSLPSQSHTLSDFFG